jgi:hypothetical protein
MTRPERIVVTVVAVVLVALVVLVLATGWANDKAAPGSRGRAPVTTTR